MLGSTRLVDIAEEKLRGIPVNLDELRTLLTPLIGNWVFGRWLTLLSDIVDKDTGLEIKTDMIRRRCGLTGVFTCCLLINQSSRWEGSASKVRRYLFPAG